MARIEVDRERCVGSGMCAFSVPGVFDQSDDDGRVVLLVENPEPEDIEAVKDAVSLCPSGALSLYDTPPTPDDPGSQGTTDAALSWKVQNPGNGCT